MACAVLTDVTDARVDITIYCFWPNGRGLGSELTPGPRKNVFGVGSELLRRFPLFGSIPIEHSVQRLFELCGHASNQVLIPRRLRIRKGFDENDEAFFIHDTDGVLGWGENFPSPTQS